MFLEEETGSWRRTLATGSWRRRLAHGSFCMVEKEVCSWRRRQTAGEGGRFLEEEEAGTWRRM